MSRERLIDGGLWGLAVVLLVGVAALSLLPQPPIGGPGPTDLLLHAAAYAPTTLVLLLAGVWRPGRGEGRFPRMTVTFVVLVLLMGAALEVVQGLGLVGPREGEVADALANAVGVGIGAGPWAVLRSRVGS